MLEARVGIELTATLNFHKLLIPRTGKSDEPAESGPARYTPGTLPPSHHGTPRTRLPRTPFLDTLRVADNPRVIRVPKNGRVRLTVAGRKRNDRRQSGPTKAIRRTRVIPPAAAALQFNLASPHSPCPAPRSISTNAASETATSTLEELPLDCHVTCSAVRERICTHRTFTLGSTDSPGFNNPPTLNF
jgi:hypothetical protein